jgi:hypothetical protein
MEILFMQTADQRRYRGLMEVTSRTVTEYCARHDCKYETFWGVFRGSHPWQATYNRIPLLTRVAASGFRGWVCYLDADAFITDLEFDLKGYLQDKSEIAVIAAPAAEEWWRINAGVLLINFSHPSTPSIIASWAAKFAAISDEQLLKADVWGQIQDDQSMLQHTLRETLDGPNITMLDHAGLFNYSRGRFIRQILRASGGLEDRLRTLRTETDRVLGLSSSTTIRPAPDENTRLDVVYEELITALYRVALLREPDPPGMHNHLRALRDGKKNIEQTLRSAFTCKEFSDKSQRFVSTYVGRGETPQERQARLQVP